MSPLRVQTGILVAGLALAGAAWAAYPGMGTTRSAVAPDGTRYDAVARRGHTTLGVLRHGRRVRSTTLTGNYGFAMPTNAGGEGVSHDGKTLVLARMGTLGRFAVLDARTLGLRREISLHGQFTYDALSPTASTLYLIQHLSMGKDDHYYVRAYDVRAGRLVKQIVFDAQEKGEVMRGFALSRATGPTGRWVYTLYWRSNGTSFVHSLDTVDRHAFCIDLRGRTPQDETTAMRLKLTPGKLSVLKGTKVVAVIDTKSLRVTKTGRPYGGPSSLRAPTARWSEPESCGSSRAGGRSPTAPSRPAGPRPARGSRSPGPRGGA
jgi:hypothetical protein